MKCRLTEKKSMTIMLIVGVVMMLAGGAAGFLLEEQAHTATRLAGMVSGIGTALAVMAAAVLIRRKRLGEARAKDSELAMNDERGLAVAFRAQNVAAIAAILCIVAIMVVALVRGDEVYMYMGIAACFICSFAKLLAYHLYNRMM